MTVAAGFTFNKGVLLCADTQYTSPSVKFFDTKLTHMSFKDRGSAAELEVVFAMSGTDGHMQAAISKCEIAIVDGMADKPCEEFSEISVRECLEKAMIDVYEKHFYKHKHYGYVGGPEVSLIIGVLVPGDKAYLYWTHETTVNEIAEGFMFVGSGCDIARYVTTPLIKQNRDMTLEEVSLLATHALRTAKSADPHTGGDSEFAALHDGQFSSGIAHFDISRNEAYSKTFEDVMRNLFFASADLNLEDEEVRFNLRYAEKQIEKIRKEQRRDKQKRDQLLNALTKPRQKPVR